MKNPVKTAVLVTVILCLLSLLPLSACIDSGPKKSFIWKISSETNSIYLLGSIHAASPDIYPLDSAIENAFELADNLVVEVDITQMDGTRMLQLMLDYGTYPQGGSLRDYISEDLYAQLDEQFEELGVVRELTRSMNVALCVVSAVESVASDSE